MGRALLVILVAIGTALVVFWLAAPRLLSSPDAPGFSRKETKATDSEPLPPSSVSPPSSAGSGSSSSNSDAAIAPPLNPEERAYEDVEAKRAPFYTWVRQNYPAVSDMRPATEDQATLEIYFRQDEPQLVTTMVYEVIWPQGRRNGFRRVRFYLPNPPGSVERYRLDAEATPDAAGVWNTFRK